MIDSEPAILDERRAQVREAMVTACDEFHAESTPFPVCDFKGEDQIRYMFDEDWR